MASSSSSPSHAHTDFWVRPEQRRRARAESSSSSGSSSAPGSEEDLVLSLAPGHCLVHTGNIRNCNHLQRAPATTTTEEVSTALACTIAAWNKYARKSAEAQGPLTIEHPKLVDQLGKSARDTLEVTAKMFFCTPAKPGAVAEALSELKRELGIESVDVALVAVPPHYEGLPVGVATVWSELQEEQAAGSVARTGVCDFSSDDLAALHATTHSYPLINQVNFKSVQCCPQRLIEFSQAHDIQLLTYSAKENFLDAERLNKQLEQTLPDNGQGPLNVDWVLRYTVVDTTRSVVQNLGYIVATQRTTA